MYKPPKRLNPRDYEGTKITNHLLGDILPLVTKGFSPKQGQEEELLIATWNRIVGVHFAGKCSLSSYNSGFVKVKVSDQALYSLFKTYEKPRLLAALRKELPSLSIRDLQFEVG